MFKVDVMRKGFKRPKDVPIYNDSNLSTFRGAHGEPIVDTEEVLKATNIKLGGFKKRRSTAAESTEQT